MLPRRSRRGLSWLLRAAVLLSAFCLWWFGTKPGRRVRAAPTPDYASSSRPEEAAQLQLGQGQGHNLTVNLVLATVAKDSIAWTRKLQQQMQMGGNLRVVRYVSDDAAAPFRPPIPRKGREALMYHTYLHDFYDDLPDVSILVHADEAPWHADAALWGSMSFALARLDAAHVASRARGGYASLRLEWRQACPAWIDTSKSPRESDKQEEPVAAQAFRDSFGLPPDGEVPRFLAGACCSQFVVTREAVRSRPKADYRRAQEWLMDTELSDYLAGRVWERFWPTLFRGRASDCPREREGYCAMFGVCFATDAQLAEYNEMWRKRQFLLDHSGPSEFLMSPIGTLWKKWEIRQMGFALEDVMLVALERGMDHSLRQAAEENLYLDEGGG